jgi:phospholipase C
MTDTLGRRHFLKLGAGAFAAAAFQLSVERALAIPAKNGKGTIEDIQHIVILTQENRSFDHYFGTLRGVRGFGDPRAAVLPSGQPVWHQPNGASEVLPFRPNVASMGETFLPDPPHGWNDTHAAWNQGRHDQWVPNKGIDTMTFHRRSDLPFYYALADAFTICDAYHCSVMGPTDPNRYHLWTGWVGNDGTGGGPEITNAELGYDWSTFPERLQRAGITWKVYQDVGLGLDAAHFWGWTGDPYIGNFGDNSLLYFHQYQSAAPGTPLANGAKVGTNINTQGREPDRLFDQFRADVTSGNLPQVSYIAAPEAYTDHPNWKPNFGQWYSSQILDILTANPDLFSQTVLFLNYDEEGGFFDHMVPPTPPQTAADGASTISTQNEIFPGSGSHPAGPYGLGMRVPMLVISPWSKGGYVTSEVFDHTSVIKFIEKRFQNPLLFETNITSWRRSVVGDLTSAFDFKHANERPVGTLPGTAAYKPTNLVRFPDFTPVVPANQSVPVQEPGTRPARPLPYALHAHAMLRTSDGVLVIDMTNVGSATGVFQVRSSAHAPRTYTVEPGKALVGEWPLTGSGLLTGDLSVHGPNGFFRGFRGSVAEMAAAQLDIEVTYDSNDAGLEFTITNPSPARASLAIVDRYSGETAGVVVEAGKTENKRFPLGRFSGWYDFEITLQSAPSIRYRYAGHVETGRESTSDPLLG